MSCGQWEEGGERLGEIEGEWDDERGWSEIELSDEQAPLAHDVVPRVDQSSRHALCKRSTCQGGYQIRRWN